MKNFNFVFSLLTILLHGDYQEYDLLTSAMPAEVNHNMPKEYLMKNLNVFHTKGEVNTINISNKAELNTHRVDIEKTKSESLSDTGSIKFTNILQENMKNENNSIDEKWNFSRLPPSMQDRDRQKIPYFLQMPFKLDNDRVTFQKENLITEEQKITQSDISKTSINGLFPEESNISNKNSYLQSSLSSSSPIDDLIATLLKQEKKENALKVVLKAINLSGMPPAELIPDLDVLPKHKSMAGDKGEHVDPLDNIANFLTEVIHNHSKQDKPLEGFDKAELEKRMFEIHSEGTTEENLIQVANAEITPRKPKILAQISKKDFVNHKKPFLYLRNDNHVNNRERTRWSSNFSEVFDQSQKSGIKMLLYPNQYNNDDASNAKSNQHLEKTLLPNLNFNLQLNGFLNSRNNSTSMSQQVERKDNLIKNSKFKTANHKRITNPDQTDTIDQLKQKIDELLNAFFPFGNHLSINNSKNGITSKMKNINKNGLHVFGKRQHFSLISSFNKQSLHNQFQPFVRIHPSVVVKKNTPHLIENKGNVSSAATNENGFKRNHQAVIPIHNKSILNLKSFDRFTRRNVDPKINKFVTLRSMENKNRYVTNKPDSSIQMEAPNNFKIKANVKHSFPTKKGPPGGLRQFLNMWKASKTSEIIRPNLY